MCIAEERREAKMQGRKGQLHPTKCRVPENSRGKKAFFNEQCTKIEENNRREQLEISSRKLENQSSISSKDGHTKGQKW